VLDAGRLIVEITEDSLTQDLNTAARVLHELRDRGVRIVLDDFGTGHASLNHLRQFSFDMLKIDQSFVRDILVDAHAARLVRATIQLTRALGLDFVAEGVENEEQLAFLKGEGCNYAQGYLIGRPRPARPESGPGG
jgi:EAL domain-containing protein (putative c-di-GMP-specific phosphodiesterase class I)